MECGRAEQDDPDVVGTVRYRLEVMLRVYDVESEGRVPAHDIEAASWRCPWSRESAAACHRLLHPLHHHCWR